MTIVELMAVIFILIVLVATMIPSLVRVQTVARTSQTKTILNTLSTACNLYQAEFKYYPDAPETRDGARNMDGRNRLVQAFRGYRTDSDNETGDGWRLRKRGTLYDANYFTVTDVPFGDDPLKPGDKVFLDAFGSPIYYYVWYDDKYDPADNATGGGGPPNSGGKFNFARYVEDALQTFILISKGPDKLWENDKDARRKDDVTSYPLKR